MPEPGLRNALSDDLKTLWKKIQSNKPDCLELRTGISKLWPVSQIQQLPGFVNLELCSTSVHNSVMPTHMSLQLIYHYKIKGRAEWL